jgi:hypothetical protein
MRGLSGRGRLRVVGRSAHSGGGGSPLSLSPRSRSRLLQSAGQPGVSRGGNSEVTVALNAQDFVSAERQVVVCQPTVFNCAATPTDPVHTPRDDMSAAGVVLYCRQVSVVNCL